MAIARCQPAAGLVHHSDRGTQYTSFAFGHRLREAGILASMGRTGDAYDNALAESFFGSLECELLDRSRFVSREAAHRALRVAGDLVQPAPPTLRAPLSRAAGVREEVAARDCDHLVFDSPRKRGKFKLYVRVLDALDGPRS
jgi:transposase InsO family protein